MKPGFSFGEPPPTGRIIFLIECTTYRLREYAVPVPGHVRPGASI